MPASIFLDVIPPTSSILLLVLGFLALLVVDLLIALVEGVALTLLSWNPFRTSMMDSIIMNIASGIPNGILLVLLQDHPINWLPLSFVISILIESFVMSYFKRHAIRQNILFALIINLASYIILILPAYFIGSRP